jgi:hypothetical protein
MIFLSYICEPTDAHPDSERLGEAFVNCWIRVRSFAEAREIAERNIADENWRVISLDEIFRTRREYHRTEAEGLAYYKQALIDSEVFVWHTCPKYPVYRVDFRVTPTKANKRFEAGIKAVASYWVVNEALSSTSDPFDDFWGKKKNRNKAVAMGRKLIRAEKWRVISVLDEAPVDFAMCKNDPDLARYYDDAEEYGECLVFQPVV